MGINKSQRLELDELAAYSAWPARLMSIDHFDIRHKTPSEVVREFGDEKWGQLLSTFKGRTRFTPGCFQKKLSFKKA